MKLQSTWEGIFEKFSSIPDDEADIINLDTGEIEVNNGHLESLPDSELWYPHDSEQDDNSVSERNKTHNASTNHETLPSEQIHEN